MFAETAEIKQEQIIHSDSVLPREDTHNEEELKKSKEPQHSVVFVKPVAIRAAPAIPTQTSVPDQVFMQPPPALIVSPTVQAASLIFKSRLLFAASEQRVALDLAKVAQELELYPQTGIVGASHVLRKSSDDVTEIWDLPLSEKAKQEQLQLWLKVEGNTELAQVNVHQGGEMIVTGAATPDAVLAAVSLVVDTLQKVTAPGGEVPAYRSTFPELEYAKYVGQARVANTLWNLESIVWFVDARREETAWIGCRHVIENRICFSGVTIKDRKDTSPSKSMDCCMDALGNVEVCGMLDYGMAKIVFNQTCSLLESVVREYFGAAVSSAPAPTSVSHRAVYEPVAVRSINPGVGRGATSSKNMVGTSKRTPKANTRFADEQWEFTRDSPVRPKRRREEVWSLEDVASDLSTPAGATTHLSGVELLLAAAGVTNNTETKDSEIKKRRSYQNNGPYSASDFYYYGDADRDEKVQRPITASGMVKRTRVKILESRPFGHTVVAGLVEMEKKSRGSNSLTRRSGASIESYDILRSSRGVGGNPGKFDRGRFIEFVQKTSINEFSCHRCFVKFGVCVKMACKRTWRDPVTKEPIIQRWGGCLNKHDPKGNHMMTVCYACEAAFIDHFKCPHYPDAWRSRNFPYIRKPRFGVWENLPADNNQMDQSLQTRRVAHLAHQDQFPSEEPVSQDVPSATPASHASPSAAPETDPPQSAAPPLSSEPGENPPPPSNSNAAHDVMS